MLVKSGIGKVNAAIATTLLIQQYSPDVVLNTGSAGGFKESLEVGTVVISDEVRHHDVDATAFGYEIGQVPGMPPSFLADEKLIRIAKEAVEEIGEHDHAVGLIASGDVFMSDAGTCRNCEGAISCNDCGGNGSGGCCTSLPSVRNAICRHPCIV